MDLGFLYASKSGGFVVGFLLLPLFNRLLGPDLFGVVALILTLQAFLLLVDFGMSTVVGRDLAVADATTFQRYTTWRAAEWVISLVYLALILPVSVATWVWGGSLSQVDALGCLFMFWALTLQNIGQNALLARHRFVEAASLQAIGVLARHGLTAVALVWIAPTLSCFVVVQATVSVVQMLATRWRCVSTLRPDSGGSIRVDIRERAGSLMRTGKPLMLLGLSGAAVMQLDKVIVSGFMSPRDLAPYFLAATFCLVPITVLAAPIAQFLQPRVVQAVSAADPIVVRRTLSRFNYLIFVCALLPSAAIWLLREPLIALWLHGSDDATLVAQYSAVILPGVALGALGYVPYAVLVARQDYQFQAAFSSVMTAFTLGAAVAATVKGSVLAVCVVYAIYHTTSTIGLWWRCIRLGAGGSGVAAAGARQAALLALLVIFGAGAVAKISIT
jgi:O-antigen/teichoic acid export membrane protein